MSGYTDMGRDAVRDPNAWGVLPGAGVISQNPMGPYPGQTYANFTPYQQQSWAEGLHSANQMAHTAQGWAGRYINAIKGEGPQGVAQQGVAQQGQAGQAGFSGAARGYGVSAGPEMDMFNNPYMHQTVQNSADALTRNFQRNVLPGMSAGNVAAGGMGSSRAGIAQGLATGDLNRQVGDMASQNYLGMYNTGLEGFLNQRGQNLQASQATAANRTQAAIANMNMRNQMAMQNAAMRTQASMGNAQLGTQASLQNAQLGTQASLQNANNQFNLLSQMPQMHNMLSNARMMPSQLKNAIGTQQQMMDQNAINDRIGQWNYWDQLRTGMPNWLGGLMQGAPMGDYSKGSGGSFSVGFGR